MSVAGSASPVAEGEIIAGKYRVERTLGAGGMGVVVAATHVDLGHRVALKFLLPQALGYPDLVERFGREARAAARIQSEHVARVTDVGTLDTGAPYMVMEHLEGRDLDDVLTLGGQLPIPTAVGHVLHACEAIAEAHSMGIVHRDLKPANLFLANRPDGTSVVKVIDFGISKAMMTAEESGLTGTSAMVGSPAYMAPEQIKASRSVDARADQWSLGVVLYQLISAQKPFVATTMAELVWVILDQPHAPLRTLRPDAPAGLEAIIDRCLEKDPAKRYADVAELAHELAPYGPEWARSSAVSSAHLLGVGLRARPAEVPSAQPVLVGEPVPPASVDRSTPALDATQAVIASPQSGAGLDAAVTSPPWSRSSAGVTQPPVVSARSRRGMIVGVGAAFVLVGAVVVAFGMSRATTPRVELSQPASAQPTIPSTPLSPPSFALQALPPAPPPDIESASPLPSASAAPAMAPARRIETAREPVTRRATHPVSGTGGAAGPAAKAQTPAAAASAPKCSTVTYFDSDGVKHFKQECH